MIPLFLTRCYDLAAEVKRDVNAVITHCSRYATKFSNDVLTGRRYLIPAAKRRQMLALEDRS